MDNAKVLQISVSLDHFKDHMASFLHALGYIKDDQDLVDLKIGFPKTGTGLVGKVWVEQEVLPVELILRERSQEEVKALVFNG